MKEIRYSSQAKKDLKKIRHDLSKLKALYEVLHSLANSEELAPQYKAHQLSGNYRDCLECHVRNDFLLIWIDTDAIYVQRIGTHSELFG